MINLTPKIVSVLLACFVGIGFSYGAVLSVAPSTSQMYCSRDEVVTINVNSIQGVYSADVKFFLNGLSLVSVQGLPGFDTVRYVGTGVSTKGSTLGKIYYYINAYQGPFSLPISGTALGIAKITVRPIVGNQVGSISFYNLQANDEDSNIVVGVTYDVNNKPITYRDSLTSVVNGSYPLNSCETSGGGGGGGGAGGGSSIIIDYCPNGDKSGNPYDGKCVDYTDDLGEVHGVAPKTCAVIRSPYSQELNSGFQFSYSFGITTQCPIQKAKIEGALVRSHFAKMITEFAVNIIGKTPDPKMKGCDNFDDIAKQPLVMQEYIKKACHLGLMGLESDGVNALTSFEPRTTVTRAQFGTVLSRLLFGSKYNKNSWDATQRYEKHLSALKANGIMNVIDEPFSNEMRGWVMVMFMRVYESGILDKTS